MAPNPKDIFKSDKFGDDVRGAISWQITQPNGKPLTDDKGMLVRLLITFHVKHR